MNRQVFKNGVLVEEWDDVTRTYTAWNTQGVQTSTRPYTSDENAQADEGARQNAQAPDLTERVAAIEAYLFTAVPPSEDGVPWISD